MDPEAAGAVDEPNATVHRVGRSRLQPLLLVLGTVMAFLAERDRRRTADTRRER